MTTAHPCRLCTARFDSPRALRRHEIAVHARLWVRDVLVSNA